MATSILPPCKERWPTRVRMLDWLARQEVLVPAKARGTTWQLARLREVRNTVVLDRVF
jgi:hypothetical protein